jgi:hypothetical protein
MTEHLLEAIKINKERKKLYTELTQGKSNKISNLMIGLELASLPTSITMDYIAKKWQAKGIPLLVHEFIPMSETPEFCENYPFAIEELDRLPYLDWKSLAQNLSKAYKQKNYLLIIEQAQKSMSEIRQYPHLFCMTRHILESLIRCSNLTIMHLEKARELSLDFNLKPSHFLLSVHINSLHGSFLIDKLAFPIQNQGIPIIFQDVPYVAPLPENY